MTSCRRKTARLSNRQLFINPQYYLSIRKSRLSSLLFIDHKSITQKWSFSSRKYWRRKEGPSRGIKRIRTRRRWLRASMSSTATVSLRKTGLRHKSLLDLRRSKLINTCGISRKKTINRKKWKGCAIRECSSRLLTRRQWKIWPLQYWRSLAQSLYLEYRR